MKTALIELFAFFLIVVAGRVFSNSDVFTWQSFVYIIMTAIGAYIFRQVGINESKTK